MSINETQRRQTSRELTALRESLPVTDAALAERLGMSTGELADVLVLRAPDPRQVWRVRDFLVEVARVHGVAEPAFSTLVDARRADARWWFGPWEVPNAAGLETR